MITINGKSIPKLIAKPLILAEPTKIKSTHLIAAPFTGSFTEPGRFTIANWMYHLNLSHSAVHERMKPYRQRRRIPPPDGYDPWAWWHPQTALEYLQKYKKR
jgi:hypothetical protein